MSPIRYGCREWWVEILVAFLAILAIFLLVERMNIRQILFGWSVRLLNGLESLTTGLIEDAVGLIRGTTLSHLIAYVLLIMVAGLVVWRTRQRLRTLPRFTELECPRCGSELYRVHRRWPDRIVNLLVPVRRYKCQNHSCRWRGLRVKNARGG